MTGSRPPPSGIYVPAPTFFVGKQASTYSIYNPPLDCETQLQHTLFLAKNGIRGVVLLGSTGEAVHLSNDERSQVLSFVRKGLDDAGYTQFPIIAGTAANSAVETVQQLEDAKACGSEYGMVLAPSYFASAVTQQGLIEWYTEVANRSPIPILIYYYPGVSNDIVIKISTFEQLAKHPNIVGCKLSHGNISHHILLAQSPVILENNFSVFSGMSRQLLPVVAIGGAGAIDGLAGIFPKSIVHLFNLSQAGKIAEARKVQYAASRAEEAFASLGIIGVKEAASRFLGLGERDGGRIPLRGGLEGGEAVWQEKYEPLFKDIAALEATL
ncbi:hypothetical protein V1511DRAFT_460658 [Dipodascopsis uninucleata]